METLARKSLPSWSPAICHQLPRLPFSVAINIPLCCLSQNYRNSREDGQGGGGGGGGEANATEEQRSRIHDNLPPRIESQTPFNAFPDSGIPLRFHELNRRSNRCNANNIIPSLVSAASLFVSPLLSSSSSSSSSFSSSSSSWLTQFRVPRGANYNVRNVNLVCQAVNTGESSLRGRGCVRSDSTSQRDN